MLRLLYGGVVLAVLILVYGLLIAGQPFLGLALAAGVMLATWELAGEPGDSNRRKAATWVLSGLVVAYGAWNHEFLLSILVAAVLYYVSWATRNDPTW